MHLLQEADDYLNEIGFHEVDLSEIDEPTAADAWSETTSNRSGLQLVRDSHTKFDPTMD